MYGELPGVRSTEWLTGGKFFATLAHQKFCEFNVISS